MSDVTIVRLTSGEEILCTISKEDGDTITINEPTIIIPTGEGQIGLLKWLSYAEADKVELSRTSVMFQVKPVPQLAEQYRSMHSKIITPNQKLVF